MGAAPVNRLLSYVLLAAGLVSVGLGILGAFLPLLPTTPFLLLAAFCFARSSPRLHRWLTEDSFVSGYLKTWRRERAIPLYAKCLAMAMLWLPAGAMFYFEVGVSVGRWVCVLVAAVWTVILWRIRTAPRGTKAD